MSFLGPLVASTLAGGAATAASSLLGPQGDPGAPLSSFEPAGINAGGLKTSFNGGNIHVVSDGRRDNLVNRISNIFGLQAAELRGLKDRVAPGVSDLRELRLGEIENARTAAIGNLRENLARRRVLGSSFGQDALTRAEATFGVERDKIAADTFMQELALTDQFSAKEFGAKREAFNTILNELNLEANLATTLAGKATETLGANARTLSYLNAQAQQGSGQLFGQLFQPAAKAMTPGITSMFGG